MAEDPSNPLSSIIGALQQKNSDRKGVVNNKGKVSANLTPEETARYKNIFSIMKDVVDPGPEAGKLNSSTQAKIGNAAAMRSASSSNVKGSVLGGLGLAGTLLGGALLNMVDDLQDKFNAVRKSVKTFVNNSGDEILKLPAIAAKVAKFLPLKTLKMLPFIGSLVNFYFAKKHFDNEEYFDGGWELVSGIMNFLPGGAVVSPLMDGYKLYAEILANKEKVRTGKKPTFKNILKEHAMKLGAVILTKLREGKIPVLSSFYKFGEGLGYFADGQWQKGLESWSQILPAILGITWDHPMFDGLNAFYDMAGESTYNAYASGKKMAGDAWGWMKDMFGKVGEAFMSFFNGIQQWVTDTINAGKDLIFGMIPDVLKTDAMKSSQGKTSKAQQVSAVSSFVGLLGPAGNTAKGFLNLMGIQDGVIAKDGQVTRFDDQDDILAAKSGGPIDKLLDGNSAIMQTIASINAQQLNVLVEIRDGIRALQSSGSSFADTSLTSQFYA